MHKKSGQIGRIVYDKSYSAEGGEVYRDGINAIPTDHQTPNSREKSVDWDISIEPWPNEINDWLPIGIETHKKKVAIENAESATPTAAETRRQRRQLHSGHL